MRIIIHLKSNISIFVISSKKRHNIFILSYVIELPHKYNSFNILNRFKLYDK